MGRFFALIIVLFLVMACSATGATEIPVTATFEISTPEPEPIVTPNVSMANLVELASHSSSFLQDELVPLNQTATDDMNVMDLVAASADLSRIVRLVDKEVNWLDTHKPSACYRDLWMEYHNALTDYRSGAKLLIVWLDNPMYGSPDAGISKIQQATSEMDNASTLTDAATALCG